MHGSGYWYKLFNEDLLVQIYNNISDNDSVTMVPSLYIYIKAVGPGKDRWF
jgi:hypothetical protein